MKIAHEFTVPAGVDRAWEVLTDLELIAPCLPGAQITGRDGEAYRGKLKVKVGPVVSEFAGTASFVEKDDAAKVAVIEGKARDARGAGNASATITARLVADGEGSTRASVEADMKISGKLAQFGSGMIQEVSQKLIGTFVQCLEGKITNSAPTAGGSPEATAAPAATDTAEPAAPTMPAPAPPVAREGAAPAAAPLAPTMPTAAPPVIPSSAPSTPTPAWSPEPPAPAAARPAPAAAAPSQPEPEVEALDLGKYAGGAVAKRVVPVLVGIGVVAVAVVVWVATR
ncbi:MAG: SRPBCC family protein [Kineosporiaceae bacterium]